MQKKAVDQILARLIADAEFRQTFEQDRKRALRQYTLSKPEMDAFTTIDVRAVVAAATGVEGVNPPNFR